MMEHSNAPNPMPEPLTGLWAPPEKVKKVKSLIEFTFRDLQEGIEYHKACNQPYDPFGDSRTEMLHSVMYDSRCSGTAGLGWDTVDKGESKFSNRLQSRKCNDCGAKAMFFLDECPDPDCRSTDFRKYPKDSRFGISSKAHYTYFDKLKGYRLTLLEPECYDPSCRTFLLRSWFIETKNEYLTAYAKAQYESQKSNHINFMPLGRDFYRSSPCLHLRARISPVGVEIEYFDTENTTPEPVSEKHSKGTTQEIMEGKSFGKNRGKISRQD
jgi:hypothetical protein